MSDDVDRKLVETVAGIAATVERMEENQRQFTGLQAQMGQDIAVLKAGEDRRAEDRRAQANAIADLQAVVANLPTREDLDKKANADVVSTMSKRMWAALTTALFLVIGTLISLLTGKL